MFSKNRFKLRRPVLDLANEGAALITIAAGVMAVVKRRIEVFSPIMGG